LDHAERPQGDDFSRRSRFAVQNFSGEHRQGRAVHARVLGDLAQQPHSGDGRSRSTRRRRADRGVRIRRYALYLADKTGRFIAKDIRGRTDTIQWLFWQMGNLGPMSGQNNHFSNYTVEKYPYAIDRYHNEVNRLYGVLNTRLADRPYIAGDYSIADMASYPWVAIYERQHQNIDDFPHVKRWLQSIKTRPAVERAYAKAKEINPNPPGIRTAEERAILFGQTATSVKTAVR
jgi:hypothetical protein